MSKKASLICVKGYDKLIKNWNDLIGTKLMGRSFGWDDIKSDINDGKLLLLS